LWSAIRLENGIGRRGCPAIEEHSTAQLGVFSFAGDALARARSFEHPSRPTELCKRSPPSTTAPPR
jgi:hypothetical protein